MLFHVPHDASYAVEVQQAHPGRFVLVKPVDPDDPALADVIADWKKTPGAVGIRVILTQEAGHSRGNTGSGDGGKSGHIRPGAGTTPLGSVCGTYASIMDADPGREMNQRHKPVIAFGAGWRSASFLTFAQQRAKIWRVSYLDFL